VFVVFKNIPRVFSFIRHGSFARTRLFQSVWSVDGVARYIVGKWFEATGRKLRREIEYGDTFSNKDKNENHFLPRDLRQSNDTGSLFVRIFIQKFTRGGFNYNYLRLFTRIRRMMKIRGRKRRLKQKKNTPKFQECFCTTKCAVLWGYRRDHLRGCGVMDRARSGLN